MASYYRSAAECSLRSCLQPFSRASFFGLHHVYGAGLLFFIATLLLGIALFRFTQEAWFARREWEE